MEVGKPGLFSRSLPPTVIHGFHPVSLIGKDIHGMLAALPLDDALSHRITNQNAITLSSFHALSGNIEYHMYRNFPFPYQATNHLIP